MGTHPRMITAQSSTIPMLLFRSSSPHRSFSPDLIVVQNPPHMRLHGGHFPAQIYTTFLPHRISIRHQPKFTRTWLVSVVILFFQGYFRGRTAVQCGVDENQFGAVRFGSRAGNVLRLGAVRYRDYPTARCGFQNGRNRTVCYDAISNIYGVVRCSSPLMFSTVRWAYTTQ